MTTFYSVDLKALARLPCDHKSCWVVSPRILVSGQKIAVTAS